MNLRIPEKKGFAKPFFFQNPQDPGLAFNRPILREASRMAEPWISLVEAMAVVVVGSGPVWSTPTTTTISSSTREIQPK